MILEGSYKYKDLIIRNGEIIGNPFSYSISSSQASMWIINNPDKVKSAIERNLNSARVNGDIEDCYNYVIHYFMEKNSREFIFNYFGEEFSDYDIGMYCMSNIRFAVMGYKGSVMKVRGKDTISLVTGDEFEDNNGGGAIETKIDSNTITTSGYIKETLPHEGYLIKSLSDDFIKEIINFNYYYEMKGFKAFDILKFYDSFFFDIDELKIGEDMKETHIQNVSNYLGESTELIRGLYGLYFEGRKGNDEIIQEMFRIISKYIRLGLTKVKFSYSGKELSWKNLNDSSYYKF